MDLTAFELSSDFQGFTDEDPPRPLYGGGDLTLSDGSSFNVREALDEGEGVIVIDTADQFLVDMLRAYSPPLKEVPVPEGREPTAGWADRPMTVLRAEAQRRGFERIGSAKGPVAERLTAQDGALRAGDQEAADAIRDDVEIGNPAGDNQPGGDA